MPRRKQVAEPLATVAMREFESFALGEEAVNAAASTAGSHGAKARRKAITMDQTLMKRLAIKGLAMVLYLCNQGNYRAAQYLVDRCLGSADAPFSERIAQMSADEARVALTEEYLKMGLAPAVVEQLVQAAARGESPDLPVGAFDEDVSR